MKKLLFGIVFVMIATFCVNAEAKVDVSDSGVYMSPFVGYSFAPGYGINTGCALGDQFWWGMRLEAVGSYPLAKLYLHDYLSSTEANAGYAYKLSYRKKGQTTLEGAKTFRLDQAGFKQNHWTKGAWKSFIQCCVRAVHKF